jgi:hypothetical protein
MTALHRHVTGSADREGDLTLRALADIAAELAVAGYPVFPCRVDKAPAVASGFKAATTDPAAARRLFERQGAALVGIATGAIANAAVLDLDGDAGLAWGAAQRAELPATLVVRTRRGGLHHWFRLDGTEAPRSTAGRLAPGVDTRGRGGYAIAWYPAALIAGRGHMAPWPAWLSRALASPPPPPPPPRHLAPTTAALRLLARALARVRGASAPGERVPGNRHDTLRAAARLVGGVVALGLIEEGAARRELIAAGLASGLPEREVEAVVAWGLRDGAARPLDWRASA